VAEGDNDDESVTLRAEIERLKSEGRQELPAALNRVYRSCQRMVVIRNVA